MDDDEPDPEVESGIPYLFISAGPWDEKTSSLGKSNSQSRVVSKGRVDFTEIKIHYPSSEHWLETAVKNPFEDENR